MEENSTPPATPQEGRSNGKPDDSTSGGAAPDNTQIVPVGKVDIPSVLEIVGGFILGFAGIGLSDAGFHISGLLCDAAAVACGILLLDHYIKGKFQFARAVFWVLMSASLVLFLCLIVITYRVEYPTTTELSLRKRAPKVPEITTTEWQPPELPSGCTQITVRLGKFTCSENPSAIIGRWTAFPIGVISINATGMTMGVKAPLPTNSLARFYGKVEDGRLYIGADFLTTDGRVQLAGNKARHEYQMLDVNYGPAAVEVVDDIKTPLCQIVYKEPDMVVINGVFVQNGSYAVFNERTLAEGTYSLAEKPKFAPNPIFKYPSSIYPGKLAQ